MTSGKVRQKAIWTLTYQRHHWTAWTILNIVKPLNLSIQTVTSRKCLHRSILLLLLPTLVNSESTKKSVLASIYWRMYPTTILSNQKITDNHRTGFLGYGKNIKSYKPHYLVRRLIISLMV